MKSETEPMIEVAFERDGITRGRRALDVYTRALLSLCLADKGLRNATVSVLYTSMARMRALNREFLGHDKATDVLSFPALENPRRPPRRAPFHLGDIAISPIICARQAPEFHRTTGEEVSLLLVHGFLHLLGHDHDTEQRKARMWAETDRLLALAGESLRSPRISV